MRKVVSALHRTAEFQKARERLADYGIILQASSGSAEPFVVSDGRIRLRTTTLREAVEVGEIMAKRVRKNPQKKKKSSSRAVLRRRAITRVRKKRVTGLRSMRDNPSRSPFPIGSISEGSLRIEDVALAVAEGVQILIRHGYLTVTPQLRQWVDILVHSSDEDELSDTVSYVEDVISGACPDYVYFGGNSGDPADIGFWISMESVEEARRDGDLPDLDSVPSGYRGLAIDVNDHGNVTLYEVKGKTHREIWGVV